MAFFSKEKNQFHCLWSWSRGRSRASSCQSEVNREHCPKNKSTNKYKVILQYFFFTSVKACQCAEAVTLPECGCSDEAVTKLIPGKRLPFKYLPMLWSSFQLQFLSFLGFTNGSRVSQFYIDSPIPWRHWQYQNTFIVCAIFRYRAK